MTLELLVWISGQASEASRALQALKKHNEPAARNAAVLIRDQVGHVFVFESGDVDPRQGTLLGMIVGLLVEMLGGSDPERVTAQAVSLGFPEEYLTAPQASFQPGGSALVTLLETERVQEILDLLATFQGRVWQQALEGDLLVRFATGMASEGR
jgi:uncharacterized membrane protein